MEETDPITKTRPMSRIQRLSLQVRQKGIINLFY